MKKLTKTTFAQMVDIVDLDPVMTVDKAISLVHDALDNQFHSMGTPYCYHELVFAELDRLGKRNDIAVLGGGGFPDGNWSTPAKLASLQHCIDLGCKEFDLTLNLTWIKSKMDDEILREIKLTRQMIGPDKVMKAIIHAPLLTEEEIVRICRLVLDSNEVDFIKTGTGREGKPTTEQIVQLIRNTIGSKMKIKASGGIRDLQTVEAMLKIGVDRFGCSRKSAFYILSQLD